MNGLRKAAVALCLVAALAGGFLYFKTRMSSETRHLFLPIEVFNLPIGLTFAASLPKGVSVTIHGPAVIVNRIADRPSTYPLDLSGAVAGTNRIPVSAELLNLPHEVVDVELHPTHLLIKLEAAVVKNIPVALQLMGQPAPGYTLVDTLVEPPMVTISGPKSLVDPMDRMMTQPVSIDGLAESFRKEIAVAVPEAMVLDASSRVVTIDVRIAERIETRAYSDVHITTAPSADDIHVAPPVITLEIRGPVAQLEKLDFSDGKTETGLVRIDAQDLKPGIYLLRASIQLPVDMALIAATPDFFTVTISAAP